MCELLLNAYALPPYWFIFTKNLFLLFLAMWWNRTCRCNNPDQDVLEENMFREPNTSLDQMMTAIQCRWSRWKNIVHSNELTLCFEFILACISTGHTLYKNFKPSFWISYQVIGICFMQSGFFGIMIHHLFFYLHSHPLPKHFTQFKILGLLLLPFVFTHLLPMMILFLPITFGWLLFIGLSQCIIKHAQNDVERSFDYHEETNQPCLCFGILLLILGKFVFCFSTLLTCQSFFNYGILLYKLLCVDEFKVYDLFADWNLHKTDCYFDEIRTSIFT